jgi:hypothetical protein
MAVAPVPVASLHSDILVAVFTIGSVLFHEVTPVGVVFAVIPVVVVAVVPVINSDLHTHLRLGSRHEGDRDD